MSGDIGLACHSFIGYYWANELGSRKRENVGRVLMAQVQKNDTNVNFPKHKDQIDKLYLQVIWLHYVPVSKHIRSSWFGFDCLVRFFSLYLCVSSFRRRLVLVSLQSTWGNKDRNKWSASPYNRKKSGQSLFTCSVIDKIYICREIVFKQGWFICLKSTRAI